MIKSHGHQFTDEQVINIIREEVFSYMVIENHISNDLYPFLLSEIVRTDILAQCSISEKLEANIIEILSYRSDQPVHIIKLNPKIANIVNKKTNVKICKIRPIMMIDWLINNPYCSYRILDSMIKYIEYQVISNEYTCMYEMDLIEMMKALKNHENYNTSKFILESINAV